jgi:hypothetical protein
MEHESHGQHETAKRGDDTGHDKHAVHDEHAGHGKDAGHLANNGSSGTGAGSGPTTSAPVTSSTSAGTTEPRTHRCEEQEQSDHHGPELVTDHPGFHAIGQGQRITGRRRDIQSKGSVDDCLDNRDHAREGISTRRRMTS